MARIAFITSANSRFTQQDRDLLRERHEVRDLRWTGKRDLPHLIRAVAWADASFCYFAGDEAWLAARLGRLLRRKTIIVTGGNDVIEVPDIGLFIPARAKRRARTALRLADLVLPFSRSSEADMFQLARPRRSEVLYLGVDTDSFRPTDAKEDLVVTAGWIIASNLLRKGHEPFVRAAALLPDVEFRLIFPDRPDGADPATLAYLRSIATPNVTFATDANLLHDFRRAKVYVQASGHEGFGLANAEAMACACVPVVVDRYALPEVVAETGEYVRFNDAADLARGIRQALGRDGAPARRRVMEHYTLQRRRERLLGLVDDVLAA